MSQYSLVMQQQFPNLSLLSSFSKGSVVGLQDQDPDDDGSPASRRSSEASSHSTLDDPDFDPCSPVTPISSYVLGSDPYIRRASDTPSSDVDGVFGDGRAAHISSSFGHPQQHQQQQHCADDSYDPNAKLHGGPYFPPPGLPSARIQYDYFPAQQQQAVSGDTTTTMASPMGLDMTTEQDLAEYFGISWPDANSQQMMDVEVVPPQQNQSKVVSFEPYPAAPMQTVPLDVDLGADDMWAEADWTTTQRQVLAPAFSPTPTPITTSTPAALAPLPFSQQQPPMIRLPIRLPAAPPVSPPFPTVGFPATTATVTPPKRGGARKKRATPPAKRQKKLHVPVSPRRSHQKLREVTARGETGLVVSAPKKTTTTTRSLSANDAAAAAATTTVPFSTNSSQPPTLGRLYSDGFPEGHHLNPHFVDNYLLQAQIGSGGFGFVMTAMHTALDIEVAVKFIQKDKVQKEFLIDDIELMCEVPVEVMVLRVLRHEGVVKYYDFYQDECFFYLVQELHGSPWRKVVSADFASPPKAPLPALPMSNGQITPPLLLPPHTLYNFSATPSAKTPPLFHPTPLRPSPLRASILPPQIEQQPPPPMKLDTVSPSFNADRSSYFSMSPNASPPKQEPTPAAPSARQFHFPPAIKFSAVGGAAPANASFVSHTIQGTFPHMEPSEEEEQTNENHLSVLPVLAPLGGGPGGRPNMERRPSHDLFECIEQHTKLGEKHAKFIFAQVVDTVEYLEGLGISHRDIKDENLVVDANFKVKLIDFGSAVIRDRSKPEPYYDKFFGTVTFASSEILREQAYRALPAEIWTLGVLLCFLVTGESPFPDTEHAIQGRPLFADLRMDGTPLRLSADCKDLIRGCLRPDPDKRFTIKEIKTHRWLRNAKVHPSRS